MAMKKKFLGLALAVAVAFPVSAYASNNNTTIDFDDNKHHNHNVEVKGHIDRKNGTAADGQIRVELPTKMQFTVDNQGRFTGCSFDVTNKSESTVDVFVSEFSQIGSGITVLDDEELKTDEKAATKDRSNVSLTLTGTTTDGQKNIDLYDYLGTTKAEEKILSVEKDRTRSITLSGRAGTGTAANDGKDPNLANEYGVDRDGASSEFKLVYKIQKQGLNG